MTSMLADDDLARAQARAKLKAQALVAGPLPLHLVVGDFGLPPDQVMRARMLGMAQAIGALAGSFAEPGDLVDACKVAMMSSLEQTLAVGVNDRRRLAALCRQMTGGPP